MSTHAPGSSKTLGSSLFWRYWTATSVSNVGSAVTLVALPLVAVSTLRSSAFEVSLLIAASYVGWLIIGLPAGVFAQRLPLRGLQVSMDLARAVALLSVPLAWLLDHLTFVHLLCAALVVGFANVVFDVANATFLPSLIDKHQLTSRNSLISGTYAVTQTGGPSLGGLLVQLLGPAVSLAADAVSYVLSAVILGGLPSHPRTVGSEAPTAPASELIREGWLYVRRHRAMFPSMLWASAINFTCGALLALTPVYLVREAQAPAAVVGLVVATDGVGSLLGSLVATRLAERFGTARAMLLASLIGGVLALLMPLTTNLGNVAFFAVGNAGFAAGVVVGSVVTRTHRQTASPEHLLSRVMATVRFVSWGATPVGAVNRAAAGRVGGVRVCTRRTADPATKPTQERPGADGRCLV